MIIYDIKQEVFSENEKEKIIQYEGNNEKIVKIGIICPKNRIITTKITIDEKPIEIGTSGIYEVQSKELENDNIKDLLIQMNPIAKQIKIENKDEQKYQGNLINIESLDSSILKNNVIITYVIAKEK